MNIGVIVYSLSGHTLSVAVKLMEVLPAFGHELTLERVETVGPAKLKTEGAELKTMPLVMPYDILILGAPVRGGTLPSPMRRFLAQIPSLQDKKIACFVTHFFRTAWGADQTIAQLREICVSKGGIVTGSGSVRWFSLHRQRQISKLIEDLI